MEKSMMIINSCYGGKCFNIEFLKELFKKFPPHTDVGGFLFRNETYNNDHTDVTDTDNEVKPFLDDKTGFKYVIFKETFNRVCIKETSNDKYYFLSPYLDITDDDDVIRYIIERKEGTFNRAQLYELIKDDLLNKTHVDSVESIPVDSEPPLIFRARHRDLYIYKDDYCKVVDGENIKYGKIKINMSNWKEFKISSRIYRHFYFGDVNGYGSNLEIVEFYTGLIPDVHEYDGMETVIFRLPKDEIITDLLKLRDNSISADNCNIFTKFLISGEYTYKDLKSKYETC